ncbi:MAG: S1C family serine protease [Candidatus Dormibacteraceae bacterium]
MSEIQSQPSVPAGPLPDPSLQPPAGAQSFGSPVPSWAPPPPPAPPLSNTIWYRIGAAVVLAAVIAAAAGAGIGWSFTRTITARSSTAQNNTQPIAQEPAQPGSPIQPVSPNTGGSLNTGSIAARVDPALVDINTVVGSGQAAGTGEIIKSNGEILTNNHVVDRSTSIQVTIAGHAQTFPAHVIGVDPSADIAVIQVDGVAGWPTVSFARSSSVRVGDAIVALGNALGQGGRPDVSQGSVTALDQTITASESGSTSEQLTGMIQSDATIYPGDSGGPIVNLSGQVIGMITAGDVQGFRSSASTVNYAIPSDTLLSVVNQIRSGQASADIIYGQTGYIGVSVQNIDSTAVAELNLSVSSGALVDGVQNGSAAARAGITRYSVITSVAGTQITNIDDLRNTLLAHKPGERVSITWVNQSGTHISTVTLAGVNP